MRTRRRSLCVLIGLAFLCTAGHIADAGPRATEDAMVELGRRLFFDPAVSAHGHTSCASCHDPDHGFADETPTSQDEAGRTMRKSQPILDTRHNPSAHWDGSLDHVEALVVARLTAQPGATPRPVYYTARTPPARRDELDPTRPPPRPEMSSLTSRSGAPALTRLRRPPRYAESFEAAFGTPEITLPRVARAIADYCHSIESGTSPYDRHLRGDGDALGPAAQRGLALFRGRAGCAACHSLETGVYGAPRPLLTDHAFHNNGVAQPRNYARHVRTGGPLLDPAAFRTLAGQSQRAIRSMGARHPDFGRASVTGEVDDLGRFKTPTLRGVAERAPYMHDGSLDTLEAVVRYYARGGSGRPGQDPRIRPFDASDRDVADLVAFLDALSETQRPGRGDATWRGRRKETRLRLVNESGLALAETRVLVRDAGARLGAASPRVRILHTDDTGSLTLDHGDFTHLCLEALRDEPPMRSETLWVPDTCEEISLRVGWAARCTLILRLPLGTRPPATLSIEHALVPDARSQRTPCRLGWVRPQEDALLCSYDAAAWRSTGWLRAFGGEPIAVEFGPHRTCTLDLR